MAPRSVAPALVLLVLVAPAAAGFLTPHSQAGVDLAPAPAPTEPPAAPSPVLAPWWQRSALDLNRNRIHDSLEQLSPAQFPVVIVADYRSDPGDGDAGILARLGPTVGVVLSSLEAITARADSFAQVEAVAGMPEVVMVEMGGRPYADLDVAAPGIKAKPSEEYSPQTAWELGFKGRGVVVAIMDTGVDNAHPGMQGKWVGGVDVSKPETRFTPRDGSFDADDTQGHGTSVTGMSIGTGAPDGTYSGIAPEASLVDARIGTIFGAAPGEGPQNLYDGTLQGIDWVIKFSDHNWGRGPPGIQVLSLSWGNNVGGSSDGSDVYSRGIDRLVQAGVIAVIAAGNAGPDNDGFDGLGSSSYAITIGATDDQNTIDRSDDEIASYSSRGPRKDNNDGYAYDELKPEVSASGTDIISAQFDRAGDGSGNGYGPRGSGTSYATPMVSGTVALMLEANPELVGQWRLVKEILTATAERRANATLPDIDPFWNRDFGYGIVDAYKAVKMAASLKGQFDMIDPELQAFITNTSAGNRTVSDSITVRGVSYAKRGAVERVELQVDEGPWVVVTRPNNGSQASFEYAVDTRGFADGNHTVRVRASGADRYSLSSEAAFVVKGASPRVAGGLPGGALSIIAIAAVAAPAIYFVYLRTVRMRRPAAAPGERARMRASLARLPRPWRRRENF